MYTHIIVQWKYNKFNVNNSMLYTKLIQFKIQKQKSHEFFSDNILICLVNQPFLTNFSPRFVCFSLKKININKKLKYKHKRKSLSLFFCYHKNYWINPGLANQNSSHNGSRSTVEWCCWAQNETCLVNEFTKASERIL